MMWGLEGTATAALFFEVGRMEVSLAVVVLALGDEGGSLRTGLL